MFIREISEELAHVMIVNLQRVDVLDVSKLDDGSIAVKIEIFYHDTEDSTLASSHLEKYIHDPDSMLFTQKWCSNLDPANCKVISDTHSSLEEASVKDIESLEEHFTVVENALGKITTKLESLKDECFNEEHGLKVKISSLKNREKKEYENKYKIYKNHKEEAEDEKNIDDI